MAMAGVGCGLTAGSLMIQARFSLSSKRAAIVSALTLFVRNSLLFSADTDSVIFPQFRSFGGTGTFFSLFHMPNLINLYFVLSRPGSMRRGS